MRTYHHAAAAKFGAKLEAIKVDLGHLVLGELDDFINDQPSWAECDPGSQACAKEAVKLVEDLWNDLDDAVNLLYLAATVEPVVPQEIGR